MWRAPTRAAEHKDRAKFKDGNYLEEIDLTREANPQMPLREAIVTASTSRLRPVFLAAATTILGMLPLLTAANRHGSPPAGCPPIICLLLITLVISRVVANGGLFPKGV